MRYIGHLSDFPIGNLNKLMKIIYIVYNGKIKFYTCYLVLNKFQYGSGQHNNKGLYRHWLNLLYYVDMSIWESMFIILKHMVYECKCMAS